MAKKKKKKGSVKKRIFITFFLIIVVLTSGFFFICDKFLGNINTVDITDDENELMIESKANKNDNIINIALFGIDTRNDDYDGRADSIMIATLDKDHKMIKLTSIMRDTYVSIPGKKYDKINHCYSYGGPELTIKTINLNFDMNIKNYVTVNFESLEKIVDSVDGVEIEVSQSEIDNMDMYQVELDRIAGNTSSRIKSAGTHTLTGRQAVAYCRIRYVGNGDYERTERQRKVLEQVVKKVLNDKSLSQALALIETLAPNIETSLTKTEMISLATSVFTSGIKEMKDTRLPIDGHAKGGTWNGVYYLKPNTLVDNVSYLHKFIYEDENYTPSEKVSEISNKINN